MKKKLIELLSDEAHLHTQRTAVNFAIVLGMSQEIAESLALGWPLKTIWELLKRHEIFVSDYQAFYRAWKHVAKASEKKQNISIIEQHKNKLPQLEKQVLPPDEEGNEAPHIANPLPVLPQPPKPGQEEKILQYQGVGTIRPLKWDGPTSR